MKHKTIKSLKGFALYSISSVFSTLAKENIENEKDILIIQKVTLRSREDIINFLVESSFSAKDLREYVLMTGRLPKN